jgi:hypothetical protein
MPIFLIPGDYLESNAAQGELLEVKETTVGELFPDNDYHLCVALHR